MQILETMAKTVEENKDYLTELDSIIGDGDHGVNLARGFTVVLEKLPTVKNKSISCILKTVGFTLLESVGGSVGVLYGRAMIKAGETVRDKEKICLDDLVKMSEAAEEAVKSLGQAEIGDKTMLDTIHPFVETLKKSLNENVPLMDALEWSVEAAKMGLENTKNMVAKKGRAKYLGEKSLGHQDVGATSCYLMIESALKMLRDFDQQN